MSRPTFDDTYLNMAHVLALRAACTRSQVGAILVKNTYVIACGYNGTPPGTTHCTDGGCPRGNLTPEQVAPGSAYDNCSGLHAEMNALLRAGRRGREGTLYVTREPCDWCWKNITSAGVARVAWRDGDQILDRYVGLAATPSQLAPRPTDMGTAR